eukprot:5535947-Alexandrium_andersonii.AAC.1
MVLVHREADLRHLGVVIVVRGIVLADRPVPHAVMEGPWRWALSAECLRLSRAGCSPLLRH